MTDGDLLAACPDYISIGAVFKATPHAEGEKRFVFCEASNETLDQEGEVIVAKALKESSDFYLKFGNVDLEHLSKLGPKFGIPNYQSYEIGVPREVRQDGRGTFVKAEIYRGDGQAAEKANMFWSSLVDVQPPARWYPSVAGRCLHKAIEVDPGTQARKAVIRKLQWTNIGFSKTPVNPKVGICAPIPVGAFAKCWGADGLDVAKALEAGYGTDSATLTGGGAMREQSLYGKPLNYFDFRNKLAKAMREGAIKNPASAELVKFSTDHLGLSESESSEYVERFVGDLKTGMRQGRVK